MMMMNGVARAISAYYQSSGGGGGGLSFTEYATITAPVVSVTTTQDLLPTVGVQTTTSFSSTQPGHWSIASNVPGATLSVASDMLSATITWTPQAYPVCSIYVAARCVNAGGSSIGVCRAHPGMRGVVKVGTGWDYSTLRAAFAAVKAFANPGGYAFVIKDGTYTAQNMFINFAGQSDQDQPPCGEYTTNTSGTDPVYTITRFTSVMAETPFGVVFDGGGTGYGHLWGCGIQLWGGTSLEDYERNTMGWDNTGAVAGRNLRGIHLAGFVTKDTEYSGWISFHCDHIFYEYGIGGEVARLDPNSNMTALQFQRSLDCVMENMYSFGPTRYNESTYESKRIQMRRVFGRKDVVKTQEPHGGVIFYRGRNCRADNFLHFDADQLEEFDTTQSLSPPSQDVGFMGIAATGVTSYPRDTVFNRGLMINSRMGFSENDAYDVTSTYFTDFQFNDVGAWYYKPDDKWGGGAGISAGGPSTFNNMTSVYLDNVDSEYTANAFRKRIDINDSILYNMGHQYDGSGRGLYNFAYASGPDNYVHLTNVTNYGASFATEIAGNASYYVKTNVDTTTNPTTQGMRYPGRLEAGSAYKTSHRGQDNFYHAVGPRGYNWGQTNYTQATNQNWLEEGMIELALPHFRAYSYTGATNTLGTQTLSGNRGGAQSNRNLIDYVISKVDRDVPFPLSVHIQTSGSGHYLSLRQFASYYMTNVTAFKVYQNGTLVHTSSSKNVHGFYVTGLTVGASITITAVDSVYGESGHSFAVTVP